MIFKSGLSNFNCNNILYYTTIIIVEAITRWLDWSSATISVRQWTDGPKKNSSEKSKFQPEWMILVWVRLTIGVHQPFAQGHSNIRLVFRNPENANRDVFPVEPDIPTPRLKTWNVNGMYRPESNMAGQKLTGGR